MVAQLDWSFVKARPGKAITRLLSYLLFEGRPITTRGRWINPLSRATLRAILKMPRDAQVDRPVFIIGSGRSGTTILGKLLAMHRDVGFLNEPKAMWHMLSPYEDVIGNYSSGDAKYRFDASDADPVAVQSAQKLFGGYLSMVRARRLVDKYPELLFRLPYVRTLFPDAKFVLIVRDAYQTCASISDWQERHRQVIDGVEYGWWGVNGRKWQLLVGELVGSDSYLQQRHGLIGGLESDVDKAAVEWLLVTREGLRQVQSGSDDLLLVRYEDLVRNPTGTVETVCEFAGLADDKTVNRYAGKIVKSSGEYRRPKIHNSLQTLLDETTSELDGQFK